MDVEATTQIQEVKKAIVVLRELNADDQLRAEAHYREKRLHDEATALGHARREGRAEGLAEGEAIGTRKEREKAIEILRSLGHSEDEIRQLYPDG